MNLSRRQFFGLSISALALHTIPLPLRGLAAPFEPDLAEPAPSITDLRALDRLLKDIWLPVIAEEINRPSPFYLAFLRGA